MEHAVFQFAHDLDREIALSQQRRELSDDVIRQNDIFTLDHCLHAPDEPLGVGHGIVQRRLFQLHEHFFKIVCKRHACGLHVRLQLFKNRHFLARGKIRRLHPALIGRGDIGHQNGHVADNFARAA